MDIFSFALAGVGGVLILIVLLLASCKNTRQVWAANAPAIGNAAQIASALIGFFGFALIIVQLHDNRAKATDEALRAELADARRLYVTYSASALQYPELTEPRYNELLQDHWKYVRYKTFVAHMLWAYDDILSAVRAYDDEEGFNEWLLAFRADLEPHLRYLCQEVDANYLQQYRPELRKHFSDTVRGRCKDQEPLKESAPQSGEVRRRR